MGKDLQGNDTWHKAGNNQPSIVLPYAIYSKTVGKWTVDAEAGLNFVLAKDAGVPVGTTDDINNAFLKVSYRVIDPLALSFKYGDGHAITLGASYDIMPGVTGLVNVRSEFGSNFDSDSGSGSNWAIIPEVDFDFAPVFGYLSFTLPLASNHGADRNLSDNDAFGLELRVGAKLGALTARVTVGLPLWEAISTSAQDEVWNAYYNGAFDFTGSGSAPPNYAEDLRDAALAALGTPKPRSGLASGALVITPHVRYDISETMYAYVEVPIKGVLADLGSDKANSSVFSISPGIYFGMNF
ncbi:hypothetical protein FACS1894102_5340 [Spirochaetia bacterium]|nr:hypothetical protein FACS1894102_5340 [Spirochaetia bacterium]